MDEVNDEYTAREGENARIPPMAHRRRAIPANAVVCLWESEIVNDLR